MKSSLVRISLLPPELWAWRPAGADGQGDDAGSDDAGDSGADDDAGGGDDDDGSSDDSGEDEAVKRLRSENETLKNRMKQADRNRSEAQRKLDELQRKEKTDLENALADVQRLNEESQGWKGKYESLALTNSFLIESSNGSIAWHDPVVAQSAAAALLKDLEISEDGSVEGMAEAVKKLAKDKPFLVKKADDSDDGQDTKTQPAGRTGTKVGAGKTGGKGKAPGTLSEEELIRRFPALRQ